MAILALLAPFIPIIDKLVGLIPNANDRAKAKEDFMNAFLEVYQEQMKGQLEVNKVEAASNSIFIAGWRPFIGWVCGCAFCYTYLITPLANAGLALYGSPVQLPPVNTDIMMELTLGMLGMAGLRTFDKMKAFGK